MSMTQNKAKQNESFYTLLKEILDTQKAIIEMLNKLNGEKSPKSESEIWKGM